LEENEDLEINLWAPKNIIEIMVNNDGSIPDDEKDGFSFIS
jgi:hypothetical protein